MASENQIRRNRALGLPDNHQPDISIRGMLDRAAMDNRIGAINAARGIPSARSTPRTPLSNMDRIALQVQGFGRGVVNAPRMFVEDMAAIPGAVQDVSGAVQRGERSLGDVIGEFAYGMRPTAFMQGADEADFDFDLAADLGDRDAALEAATRGGYESTLGALGGIARGPRASAATPAVAAVERVASAAPDSMPFRLANNRDAMAGGAGISLEDMISAGRTGDEVGVARGLGDFGVGRALEQAPLLAAPIAVGGGAYLLGDTLFGDAMADDEPDWQETEEEWRARTGGEPVILVGDSPDANRADDVASRIAALARSAGRSGAMPEGVSLADSLEKGARVDVGYMQRVLDAVRGQFPEEAAALQSEVDAFRSNRDQDVDETLGGIVGGAAGITAGMLAGRGGVGRFVGAATGGALGAGAGGAAANAFGEGALQFNDTQDIASVGASGGVLGGALGGGYSIYDGVFGPGSVRAYGRNLTQSAREALEASMAPRGPLSFGEFMEADRRMAEAVAGLPPVDPSRYPLQMLANKDRLLMEAGQSPVFASPNMAVRSRGVTQPLPPETIEQIFAQVDSYRPQSSWGRGVRDQYSRETLAARQDEALRRAAGQYGVDLGALPSDARRPGYVPDAEIDRIADDLRRRREAVAAGQPLPPPPPPAAPPVSLRQVNKQQLPPSQVEALRGFVSRELQIDPSDMSDMDLRRVVSTSLRNSDSALRSRRKMLLAREGIVPALVGGAALGMADDAEALDLFGGAEDEAGIDVGDIIGPAVLAGGALGLGAAGSRLAGLRAAPAGVGRFRTPLPFTGAAPAIDAPLAGVTGAVVPNYAQLAPGAVGLGALGGATAAVLDPMMGETEGWLEAQEGLDALSEEEALLLAEEEERLRRLQQVLAQIERGQYRAPPELTAGRYGSPTGRERR